MFFDYCGSKIYFEDLNGSKAEFSKENEKETIAFLHGWGSDCRVFAGISQNLSQKYRCVLIDFSGFGKSEIPKFAFSAKMQADMVLALCNFLEIKKFHILSHSYGGRVSLDLLSRKNSRIISALLIAPAGVKDKSVKMSAKRWIFKIRKMLTKKQDIQKLEKYYSQDYRNARGVMRETFMRAVAFDQTFQLCNIKSKVLIIRGHGDTAVTKTMVKTMQRRMKNCELCEIDGDHFAFLQSGQEFKMIAETFFEI